MNNVVRARSPIASVFATCMLLGAGALALDADEVESSKQIIVPDAECQAEIARVVRLLSADEMSKQDVSDIVGHFKSFRKDQPEELLSQLLLVYGGRDEYKANPKAEMAKRVLINNVAESISGDELVRFLAPYLEQASNVSLQRNVGHVLALVAFRREGRPNFDGFVSYIRTRRASPPPALISLMYRIDPKQAALAVARACEGEDKAGAFADALVSEDVEVLDRVSKEGVWWKDLYVAARMQKTRRLRSKAVLERLGRSEHELVRRMVSEGNARRRRIEEHGAAGKELKHVEQED